VFRPFLRRILRLELGVKSKPTDFRWSELTGLPTLEVRLEEHPKHKCNAAHNAAFPIPSRQLPQQETFRARRSRQTAPNMEQVLIYSPAARMQPQDGILARIEIGVRGRFRLFFRAVVAGSFCWKSCTTFLVLWFCSSQFVCLLCRFVCWGLTNCG